MTLALTNLRLWDGEADRVSQAECTVRIDEGRIVGIGNAPALTREARVVPLGGAIALPGLIDAHVHLCLDPAVVSPRDQFSLSEEELRVAMEERAGRMLAAGITTARDCGGGHWAEVALRDRIAAGEVLGPRLLCAGQPITSPGGHCHFWGGEARGAAGIDAVIRRQLARSVDWIKVMATGGVMTRGTKIGDAQFSEAELQHLVASADAAGRAVAAHCHGALGIERAARAGIRTIEHCSFAGLEGFGSDLSESALAALAERAQGRPLWISPTVNAGWGRHGTKDGELTPFGVRMSAVLGAVRERGLPLIASTDAGIPRVAHDRLAAALPVMSLLSGMSAAETLRSATSESARALGLEDVTGKLKVGLAADILVVDGDPLSDWASLLSPRLVVAQGRLVPESSA